MSWKTDLVVASGSDSKRSSSRRDLRLRADGADEQARAVQVEVLNLSESGALIETRVRLRIDQPITINLPDVGATASRIVWSSGQFYGCQFEARLSKAAVSAALLRSEPKDEGAETFSMRLRALRLERGLSIADVARKSGFSKVNVWKWERGEHEPRDQSLRALAQALDVPPQQLVESRNLEFDRQAVGSMTSSTIADVIADARSRICRISNIDLDRVNVTVELRS